MYTAFDKAYELAPNNISVLNTVGMYTTWGGDCTEEQVKDFKSEKKYFSGNCRWQKGYEILKKADQLDKANTTVGKYYAFSTVLITENKYEEALMHMQKAQAPGFIWYEIHSGLIHFKLGNKSSSTAHFDVVKKIIGSSKLKDLEPHFHFWNQHKVLWNTYRSVFEQNGFI